MNLVLLINLKIMLWMKKNVSVVIMMKLIILIKKKYLKLYHKLNLQKKTKIKYKLPL